MRLFATYRKVVLGIILRWWWLFAIILFLFSSIAAGILWMHGVKSIKRYEAQTRLLFTPKKIDRVDAPNDRQLMSILERKSLKRRVATRVDVSPDECMCLATDMEIVQAKRPTNLFTLKASSQTYQGAVDKVNAYAEILIDEYVAYRKKDLDSWLASLQGRRKGMMEKLSEVEAEETALKSKTGVLSPQDALLALNSLISDQRRNDSVLGVEAANEEIKKKKLEEFVGENGKIVVENAQAIRRRAASISAVDADLVALRERYTDLNPKVIGRLEDRARLVAELQEFLKSKGADNVDIEKIDQMEKCAGELAGCVTRIDAIREKRHALQQEIKDNEARAVAFGALIPDYEKIVVRRADIMATVRDLDEQIGGIAYAGDSLRNDLRQIERAGGSGDRGTFTVKYAAVTVLGALCAMGLAMFVTVVLELLFGKVRGAREIAAYDGIEFVGALPSPNLMTEEDEKEVAGVISLKTLIASKEAKTVLLCRLPGATLCKTFVEAFDFTATMSGISAFMVDVVSQEHFNPPEDAEQMIGLAKKGSSGWFPVANRYALAPTELQILKADIESLRDTFDLVFIRMEGGVRIGGSFFDQLLELSGGVLLEVGAGKTPRSVFAYARRHVAAAGKPVLAVSTDESARRVRIEMEERS